jgi:predicted Zn-dependent protease
MKIKNWLNIVVLIGAGVVFFAGCQTMDVVSDVGADIGKGAGVLTDQQADSVKKSGKAVGKAFESFTPEQEYYLGRSVGAVVLNAYKPYSSAEANHYLNVLGQTLAQFSDKPNTFAGYHFLIMATDEVNAFGAPGGLIFVSRGLIKCCKSEDALAAVLAHEIGHIQLEHGIKSIKRSRLTGAVTTLLMETGKSFTGQELSQLTEAFEGSVSDITQTMMNAGYSRGAEYEADKVAIQILQRAGYNPAALIDMLKEMKNHLAAGGHDFAKTHPAPDARIKEISKYIGSIKSVQEPPARQQRFEKFLKTIH